MLKKGNSTTFKTSWTGIKKCKSCNCDYSATSGNRRFCDECIAYKTICPECNGKKSLYDKFCGNSCSGKWKFRNSVKVKEAIEFGRNHPSRCIGIGNAFRGKPRYKLRGENNPNWKGGTYGSERNTDMGRVEYKNWRKSVYERDGFTCTDCGVTGGNLNADHILPYSLFPELRYSVPNGRTLCKDCHKKKHTYSLQNIKREEFLIF